MKQGIGNNRIFFFLIMILIASPTFLFSQEMQGKMAKKPLFRDPVYDGAADPTVIWNQKEQKWFMLYTNRLANVKALDGVSWVHGTRIGIAVTNNWANRLIGDEQEPADFDWGKDRGEKMGRAMLAYPDWFIKNQPRQS